MSKENNAPAPNPSNINDINEASHLPHPNTNATENLGAKTIAPGQAIIEFEGEQEVFYRGSYVTKIPLNAGSICVGRRDVMAGHYPDVDLIMYRKMDPVISRRHLRFYRDINGDYFVEDLCANSATFINSYDDILNGERRKLQPGDRIFISISISIQFRIV